MNPANSAADYTGERDPMRAVRQAQLLAVAGTTSATPFRPTDSYTTSWDLTDQRA
jgi:hypothetical protein